MSDFPRGWFLSSDPGSNATAVVVAPAIAGVVHVFDAFNALIVNGTAGNAGGPIIVFTSDGALANIVIGRVFAPAGTSDTASGSGLDLAGGPGASLTVEFNFASAVGQLETLIVQGHDI